MWYDESVNIQLEYFDGLYWKLLFISYITKVITPPKDMQTILFIYHVPENMVAFPQTFFNRN